MPARKKPAQTATPAPETALAVRPPRTPVPETPEAAAAQLQAIKKAGDVNVNAVLAMQQLVPPEMIAQVVMDLITGTRWSGKGEDAHEVPDVRAREAGAKLYLAYTVGLPIQRVETINREIIEQDDPVARAAQSPATRRAIARTLEAQLEAIKAMDAEPETPDSK